MTSRDTIFYVNIYHCSQAAGSQAWSGLPTFFAPAPVQLPLPLADDLFHTDDHDVVGVSVLHRDCHHVQGHGHHDHDVGVTCI